MLSRLMVALLLLLLVLSAAGPSCAQEEVGEVWVVRYVEDGRMLIEMRVIFEWIGWLVDWDPIQKGIHATIEGYDMQMWIDHTYALVNGEEFFLDVPPRLWRGKTYVPLRFVAEVTGCQVDYYGSWVQVTNGDEALTVHIVD